MRETLLYVFVSPLLILSNPEQDVDKLKIYQHIIMNWAVKV